MTQPDPTAPGAPEAQPADPPADPTPVKPAEDISSLPDWAQKQIKDARAEAAKSRTTAKQQAAEEAQRQTLAQVAKALGLGEDEAPDVDGLTEQIEHSQAVAFRSSVELGVFRAASALGADAEALLDSNKFIDSLDGLVDEDPRSKEFAEAVRAKVQEAVEANPKYKAAGQESAPNQPRADPSQGARGNGPTPFAGQSLTSAIAAHYQHKR